MGVGLMTDIPDKFVVGGVEDIMQGHGEFHHTKTGCEMAWMRRKCVYDIVAQLVGQRLQLLHGQFAQFSRIVDISEKHYNLPFIGWSLLVDRLERFV